MEQVPNPSHTPVVPQVMAACWVHRGCPLPADTGEQVPRKPTRLHDRHAPPQAVLQQTPSAQWPEAHSTSPFGQSAPFIFLPQLPAEHLRPLTHSASLMQVPKQLFGVVAVLHEKGAQMVAAASLQEPAPSQAKLFVTASPSHVPGMQIDPAS